MLGRPRERNGMIGWIPLAALVGVWMHAATRRRRSPDLARLRRGAVVLLALTGLLAVAVVAAAVFGAVVLHGFYGIFAPLVIETPVPDLDFGVATSLVHHPATVAATTLLAVGAGATVQYGRVRSMK